MSIHVFFVIFRSKNLKKNLLEKFLLYKIFTGNIIFNHKDINFQSKKPEIPLGRATAQKIHSKKLFTTKKPLMGIVSASSQ